MPLTVDINWWWLIFPNASASLAPWGRPYLPRPADLQRKSLKEKFFGTFRCQTY
jgi:hypothetical protein